MKNKVYKIGDKIENIEEIEEVATGIALKGLKVIEANGNLWASRIIERKDIESFEDIKHNVILKLLENDLIISKECYNVVNAYMYNYKVNKIKNVEIIVNEETNATNLDKNSYIEYIKEYNNGIIKEETKNKFCLDALNLTDKQKEILNIYSKTNSMQKTADLLGIAKSSVQKTIERIREKTQKICYSIEY